MVNVVVFLYYDLWFKLYDYDYVSEMWCPPPYHSILVFISYVYSLTQLSYWIGVFSHSLHWPITCILFQQLIHRQCNKTHKQLLNVRWQCGLLSQTKKEGDLPVFHSHHFMIQKQVIANQNQTSRMNEQEEATRFISSKRFTSCLLIHS